MSEDTRDEVRAILREAEAWARARKAEGWTREDFLREFSLMLGTGEIAMTTDTESNETENASILLGTGVVSWPADERRSDRYGSILLHVCWKGGEYKDGGHYSDECVQLWVFGLAGQHGKLVATVKEARPSPHMGDLARGILPRRPVAGEVIELGAGELFFHVCGETDTVGVRPLDRRHTDWMNVRAMYDVLHQTVELRFIPQA